VPFFMLFGSLLGNFEEMIPLVLVIVPLAHILGWDSLVGLGLSLLAVAFGFAAAIPNPFTLGVAQSIAGVGAGLLAGMSPGRIAGTFAKGTVGILPGVLLILMAMSVQPIIAGGGIMDTVLHGASLSIARAPRFLAVLLICLLVLASNFFIGSATAKSFLVMPILTPLADLVGVNRQIVVLAFTFGDGFSNVLYPTNALLLIALSFTVVGYTRWLRWGFKLQAVVFALTVLFLLLVRNHRLRAVLRATAIAERSDRTQAVPPAALRKVPRAVGPGASSLTAGAGGILLVMFRAFRQDDPGSAEEPGGPAGPSGPESTGEEWLAELLADRREVEPQEERSLYCFVCGEIVTRIDQRLSIQGDHRHTFTNPGGYIYEIGCFRDAEGCGETGEFTEEYTWFTGYAWRYAYCGSCRVHLGWAYEGAGESPARFFGLILNRLVAGRQDLASRS